MTGRDLTRIRRPTASRLLARILDEPELIAAVQALEPAALGRLVDHVGLEDAGELVALATTEQLVGLLDDDLWRAERAGRDESFDDERFALWLEVMVEAGEQQAAGRLAELPEDLVVLGLHRRLLVLDLDLIAVELTEAGEDADPIDKALDGRLTEELDRYLLVARRERGWDALLALLVELDRDHHELLERLLERCAALSSGQIEENGGLWHVLSAEETLEADLAGEREDRRAAAGHVAPSAAASFLASVARSPIEQLRAATGEDPVTRAAFRDLARLPERLAVSPRPRPGRTAPEADAAGKLAALLAAAEVLPSAAPLRARLGSGGPSEAGTDPPRDERLGRALAALEAADPELAARRKQELAYLANLLLAGWEIDGRAPRPLEAAGAALDGCSRGLADLAERAAPTAASGDLLAAESAVKLFRIGWRLAGLEAETPTGRERPYRSGGRARAARGPGAPGRSGTSSRSRGGGGPR